MLINIRPISTENFVDIEDKIRANIVDPELRDEVRELFEEQFGKMSVDQQHQYFFTYLRLYASLMWKSINLFEVEKIADKLLSSLVLPGILLDYDLLSLIKGWLTNYTFSKDHLQKVYSKFRQKIFESKEIMGTLNGVNYCIGDLVKELDKNNKLSVGSMERTETILKIKKIIESNDATLVVNNYTDDIGKSAAALIEFCNFFVMTPVENIEEKININLRSESKATTEDRSKNLEKNKFIDQERSDESKPIFESNKQFVNSDTRFTVAPQALVKPPSIPKKNGQQEQAPKKLTYREIRKKIESTFPKDANGNFISITDVLAELQKTAAFQGDPRIKDLFIFNEQKSGFEWNEPMFKE